MLLYFFNFPQWFWRTEMPQKRTLIKIRQGKTVQEHFRCICCQNLMTVAPPNMKIWVFDKGTSQCANPLVNITLRGVLPWLFSKRCICCPTLTTKASPEGKSVIMVLLMLKSYSVLNIFFARTERQHVDQSYFENLTITFVLRFYVFLWCY